MKKKGEFKHSGKTDGKSNALGHGGRAEQFKKKLSKEHLPGGKREIGAIIGKQARKEHAAPGERNYHDNKKPKEDHLGRRY